MSKNVVSNSLLLVAAAIAQKVIVFVVNQLSVAYSTPEIIGQSSIQLELWLSTCLFISREAIRITCLRYDLKDNKESKRFFVNLSWLPVILVILISGVLIVVFGGKKGIEDHYSLNAYYLYSIAAFIETLGEPWYNLYNNQVFIEARIRAETLGFLVKSLVTFIAVAYFQLGLLGFGVAQLLFAIVYLLILLGYFSKFNENFFSQHKRNFLVSEMFPKFQSPYFSTSSLTSLAFLSTSSIVKHCLTEADKISLAISCSSKEQGIYAVTNNYGSLVARLFYLPLEDSTRVSLSYLKKNSSGNSGKFDSQAVPEHLANEGLELDSISLNSMKQLLLRMLKVVVFVSMGIAALGPAFVRMFTMFVLRKNATTEWNADAVTLSLILYCYYLPLMGINGLAEAFIQVVVRTSTSGDFLRSNIGFLGSSIVFSICAYVAVPSLGGAGIILANICAVGVRIVWNSSIIASVWSNSFSRTEDRSFFSGLQFLCSIVPQLWWWLLVIAIKSAANVSEKFILRANDDNVAPKRIILHLLIGVLCGMLYIYFTFCTCSKQEQFYMLSSALQRLPTPRSIRQKLEGKLESLYVNNQADNAKKHS